MTGTTGKSGNVDINLLYINNETTVIPGSACLALRQRMQQLSGDGPGGSVCN